MAFFSILRTAQSVIAVAEPMRKGWPASEPSPKKLPSLNMPIVASLPFLETTVSLTLPVLQVENHVCGIPLGENGLLFRIEHRFPALADGGKECMGVELAAVLGSP